VSTAPGRRARPVGLVLALGVVLVASTVGPPAEAQLAEHTQVVSDDPVNWTPHVLDGQVNAVAQVGTTAVVGGTFTQVQAAGSAAVLDRSYLFAVDTTTGEVLPGFAPVLNDEVESIAVAPGGSAVIVGGGFTTVNGVTRRRVARIDVPTGAVDTGFTANAGALVQEVVVRGGWLYASGKFTTLNGSSRSGLARLDPTTGAVDPGLDLPFTTPPRGTMGVPEIDVSPDGSTLVAVGNFSVVGGLSRVQIAMLDLTTSPVSVASWQTDAFPVYNPNVANASWCSTSFDSYMRDVDFAPDSSYFVVVTTGSNRPTRLCDTVSRWEASARGAGQQPTWADWSGGDSFTGVGVTGSAVYAGGHQQWMNNPYIAEACGVCPGPGPGGVPRQGLAALDPVNGLPLTWDPGRTRGMGVFAFLATADGLWVGSDTDVLGGETHRKLGFFPVTGGISVPPNVPYPITADLFALDAATGNLVRRPFADLAPGAGTVVPTGVDWRQARGAFALGGRLYTGWSDGTFSVRDFDGTSVGAPTQIDLHGLEVAPPTMFKIPGTRTAIPSLSAQLAKTTGMFFDDGRLYYTVSGDNRLYYRYFTPQSRIVGANLFVASTGDGVPWSKVRGMTMSSGQLVYSASGKLYRVAFDGKPVGAVIQVGGKGKDGINYTSTGLFSFQP
jgi:hypothetical protein